MNDIDQVINNMEKLKERQEYLIKQLSYMAIGMAILMCIFLFITFWMVVRW